MHDSFVISHEVVSAINHNIPVVALESSVIAQGLPEGVNMKAAIQMQEVVRDNGAVPAMIGIIDGIVKVGLSEDDIEQLTSGTAVKVGVGSIPYTLLKKLNGGTTVSATVRIASAAGIAVVATGGIGGVHRGYAEIPDISEDLWELIRTPVTLVSSGIKSVLDIRATVEWLETHSLQFYGYQTDDLPAFYSSKSGISIPPLASEEDYASLATIYRAEMGYSSAILIAVPVPPEFSLDVESQIKQAINEALEQNITGKVLTPYLLKRISELTDGKTIDTNLALLRNNCEVAAKLSKASIIPSGRKCGFSV
jgi:pseudouridylate synthase